MSGLAPMNMRLAMAWMLAAAAFSAEPRPDPASRPNILHIFADDQSHRAIGAYGHAPWSWVRTPHTDRLAAEGVRFEAAYCGSWCVPSRATLLTGLQPHGIRGLEPARRRFDAAERPLWPAAFRAGGYRTAFVGKWHLKGYGEQGLWARDWDTWAAWDHTREGNGGYYAEKSPDGAQLLNLDGRERRVPGYPTDNYTGYAEGFIRRPHDRPWYLWLCYGAPHAPYQPAERHRADYADAVVPAPPGVFGPRHDKPALMRDFTMFTPGARPGDPPRYETDYGAFPLAEWVRRQQRAGRAVDDGVGRLVAALRETGQLENTIVVYSADNGFPWGEQGYANKTGPYESCQRTPLIVHWPERFARGAVCRAPVGQIDLVPTFFAAAQIPLSWAMHGRDLHPLLRDPAAPWPHPVLLEYFNEDFGPATAAPTPEQARRLRPWEPPAWWVSLRDGRHAYIRWLVDGENEELYDLARDPGQLANLARDPAHRATLAALRAGFGRELRRTHAGLATHLFPSPAP